jgi:hypothetical protein
VRGQPDDVVRRPSGRLRNPVDVNLRRPLSPAVAIAAVLLAAVGCGSSSPAGSTRAGSGASGATAGRTPAAQAAAPGPSALTPDSTSAATGDIPDNQVFLVFRNRAAGYSIRYPEGWAERGGGNTVNFRDKNNLIRVIVSPGSLPTPAAARAELGRGKAAPGAATSIAVGGAPALRIGYTTRSPADPVTGKRVTLTVDRYYLAHAGKRAVVDLGTPVGVDNVDAYRLIIRSFRWS